MRDQSPFRWFPQFLLMAALMNAGCSILVVNRPALSEPETQAPASTPTVTLEKCETFLPTSSARTTA